MMDKQADRAHQEQQRESKDFRQEPPARGRASVVARQAQSVSLWAAGIPLLEWPREAIAELASQMGNAALNELLAGGDRFETTVFSLPNGSTAPENAAHASPPERTDPSGLRCAGIVWQPFAPKAMLDRAAEPQSPNIFGMTMAGEGI